MLKKTVSVTSEELAFKLKIYWKINEERGEDIVQPSKSRKALTILGVILMTLAAGAFTWYEWAGGRELINYKEVLVLKENTVEGQIIQKENLMFQKVEKLSLIENAIVNPSEVIGKETKHFIPAGTQLHKGYFAESGLVLKDGQVIAQIPVEWTLSVPDTLRRGDEIIIYSALYDKTVLDALKSAPRTQEVVTSKPTEKEDEEEVIVSTDGTEEPTEVNDSSTPSEFSEALETRVAYVKDSSNREVVTTSIDGRLNASAVIRNVEIITTPEEFKKIEQKINSGGKLIVMYSKTTETVAAVEETEDKTEGE